MTQINNNTIAKADGSQLTSLDDLFGGRAKAWVSMTMAAVSEDSFGVSSLTDTSTSVKQVNWATAFGNAFYVPLVDLVFTTPGVLNPNSGPVTRTTAHTTFYHDTETNISALVVNAHGDF